MINDLILIHHLLMLKNFPGGSVGKESACNVGDLGSVPGSGRSPREGNGNPLQYFCLENSWTEKSGGLYSPWGRKKSDTTERLTLHFHFFHINYFTLGKCLPKN